MKLFVRYLLIACVVITEHIFVLSLIRLQNYNKFVCFQNNLSLYLFIFLQFAKYLDSYQVNRFIHRNRLEELFFDIVYLS